MAFGVFEKNQKEKEEATVAPVSRLASDICRKKGNKEKGDNAKVETLKKFKWKGFGIQKNEEVIKLRKEMKISIEISKISKKI